MENTQPIREEHRHLMRGVEHLKQAADLIDEVGFEASKREAEKAIQFLNGQLIPHARSEDDLLYPVVAGIMGSPRTTRTMSRDHLEVATMAGQLERAVEEGDLQMVRRLLYGLYHVLRLHFAKEEEIYLPLLDEHLTRKQATELFGHMHAA